MNKDDIIKYELASSKAAISRELKLMREALDLRTDKMAEKADLDEYTYLQLEQGSIDTDRINLKILFKLKLNLGLNLNKIF